MKFFEKRIKSTSDLAKALGEDESKIIELKKGEREVTGKTMDRVLESINKTEIETAIKHAEIWKWYQETDLRALRLEFGYNTQIKCARAIKIENDTLCRFERKDPKVKRYTPQLGKVYEFYNNEFNKYIEKKNKRELKTCNSDEDEQVWNWYKNTNLKDLRLEKGYSTQRELSEAIGIPQSSVADLENKKYGRVTLNMRKMYEFFKSKNIQIINSDEDIEINDITNEVMEDENVVVEETLIEEQDEKEILLVKISKLERQIMLYEKLIERL